MATFGAESGLWWAPQRDFAQCSGGLSISEWCSIARDTCCALCPQPPITGPATFIVFTLGPFLNLVMILILTQEAPYNLALATIGTDGLLLSSIVRTFRKGGGLSSYHFYIVPVFIVSCVPLAVGASLTSVSALTGAVGGAVVSHDQLYGSYNQHEADDKGVLRKGYLVKRPKGREKDKPVYAHHGPRPASHGAEHREPKELPRPRLTRVVIVTMGLHILMWLVAFSYLFFAPNIAHTQANCDEQFGLTGGWRITFAATAFSWILIATLFFIPLALGLSRKHRHSSLMMIARASHSKKFVDWVWSHQTLCRCFIAGTLYTLWVIPFISYYIKSLMTFLLLGDDPFDFGQLNWVISSLAVIFVISRSVFDYKDATSAKHSELYNYAAQHEAYTAGRAALSSAPAHGHQHAVASGALGSGSHDHTPHDHTLTGHSTHRTDSTAARLPSARAGSTAYPTLRPLSRELDPAERPDKILDPDMAALHAQLSHFGRSDSTRSGSRRGDVEKGKERARPRGGSVGSSSHDEGPSNS